MAMISDRPAEADYRAVPGHWEGDLVSGAANQSAIATLVERTTRYVMLIACPRAAPRLPLPPLSPAPSAGSPTHLWRSLTWDQGTEMAGHAAFTIATGLPVTSRSARTMAARHNENTNGLIRQYLPKGTDLSDITQDELDRIAIELNGRPRKTLGWQTPAEQLNPLVAMTPETTTPKLHEMGLVSRGVWVLGVELLAGEGAALDHAFELLELRRHVRQEPVAAQRLPAGLDHLHLGVDQVLDPLRAPDVGEPLLSVLAPGLDEQVAGAEIRSNIALAERYVVDAFERDLDAALGDDAAAVDDAVARDDEVGRRPLQVPVDEPEAGDRR